MNIIIVFLEMKSHFKCHIKPIRLCLTESIVSSTVLNQYPFMKFSRSRMSIISLSSQIDNLSNIITIIIQSQVI